ncbi:hypothetical protein CWI38_0167p0040 [Hamiltosporidium tvaerminnensis]|uniref:Uncharacterized protein n=1 Tax=Hamiltosporidium tvaerminnensis TaxID=1176355 RepID=A0A4V2JY68_9MICR|nr:hypothetical protein CWI38_0167p0040 [Hamiltosporidium tvaerminnensis]
MEENKSIGKFLKFHFFCRSVLDPDLILIFISSFFKNYDRFNDILKKNATILEKLQFYSSQQKNMAEKKCKPENENESLQILQKIYYKYANYVSNWLKVYHKLTIYLNLTYQLFTTNKWS